MEKTAAVDAADDALEAFEASVAALVALVRRGRGTLGSSGPDPLRDQADACLDGLAESARAEAMLSAVRVHLAAGYAEKAAALAGPAASPGEHTAQEGNDADHLHDWAAHGGTTGITNLAQPCPKHKPKHTVMDTRRRGHRQTTRLDFTHRTPLPQRTTRPGTTPLARRGLPPGFRPGRQPLP